MKNAKFGRLLKAAIGSIATCEGKNASAVEGELGHQLCLAPATIQRYMAGHIPPETRTLEVLASVAVRRGYLNREWLLNFLQSAGYPSPEKLAEQLCPAGPARTSTRNSPRRPRSDGWRYCARHIWPSSGSASCSRSSTLMPSSF